MSAITVVFTTIICDYTIRCGQYQHEHMFTSPTQVVSCTLSVELSSVSAVWWHWWWLQWTGTWWSPGLWLPSGWCLVRKHSPLWLLPGSIQWAGVCRPSLAGVSTILFSDLDVYQCYNSDIVFESLSSYLFPTDLTNGSISISWWKVWHYFKESLVCLFSMEKNEHFTWIIKTLDGYDSGTVLLRLCSLTRFMVPHLHLFV